MSNIEEQYLMMPEEYDNDHGLISPHFGRQPSHQNPNKECPCIDKIIEAAELAENWAAHKNLTIQETFEIFYNKLKELKDK